MTKYKIHVKGGGTDWFTEEVVLDLLRKYRSMHGHRCNKIADPSVCCPTAHGASEDECDCLSLEHFDTQEFPE